MNFGKVQKKYPAQEIEDMIDEAVAAVRTEGQDPSARGSIEA